MSRAKLRLIVFALLFVGWIGWLAYLAVVKPRPVVVSRAQIMGATHAIVAQLNLDNEGRPTSAMIDQIVAGPEPRTGLEAGKTVTPTNLGQIRSIAGKPAAGTLYLLLLERDNDSYRVATAPRSPGFDPPRQPLIYPWGPDVERQVRELMR